MLGGVSLLVGAIGIANVTLVSVMERTGEIGLRRALGATRRHIAQQFLLESSAMGFVGGILGASLGTLVVVAVSAYQTWTPVLDPRRTALAPRCRRADRSRLRHLSGDPSCPARTRRCPPKRNLTKLGGSVVVGVSS